jgi:acetylornithine/N-succinyldiaminopimelate aminotransferase
MGYGTHGTTFGGNPMACAAGSVVLDVISEPGFLDRVCIVADHLFDGLRALEKQAKVVGEVRGRGLLIGVELRAEAGIGASDVVRACRERGVLVHVAGPQVIRLAPPLILEKRQADRGLAVLSDALTAILGR